ncbi:MAG: SdrD B-like domain-containing protein [Paracoccaceae bacterium]
MIKDVPIEHGEEIKLWVDGDHGEFVRVDNITLEGQDKTVTTAEPPKEGVTVSLLDTDGNPVLDSAGAPITTVTDANGNYSFENVPEGDYRVSVDAPVGFAPTFQNVGSDDAIDSDIDANGLSDVVTVVRGTVVDVDAGLKEVPLCVDENTTFVVDLDLEVACPPQDIGTDLCAVKDDNGKPIELTLTYTFGDTIEQAVADTKGKHDLTTNGVDDDGTVFIRVLGKNDDPLFEGTIVSGESFSFDNDGDKFDSETVIEIYDEPGSAQPFQVIDLHTSCSAPLAIGDTFGSVTIAAATTEDGTVFGAPGGTVSEPDLEYSIVGGADAALFTVDAQTGEVSFIDAPDFENPQDQGGDNFYDVVVRATSTKPELVDVHIDFETLADGTTLNAGDGGTLVLDGVTLTAIRSEDTDGVFDDAMIFDAEKPTGGDKDLKQKAQGNVLIISEDGDSSDPDDEGDGGTLMAVFDQPSTVKSIVLLDTEEKGGTIDLFDDQGQLIASFEIPSIKDGKLQTIDLGDTAGVTTMKVNLPSSGAIDDLKFASPGEAKFVEKPLQIEVKDVLETGTIAGRAFCDVNGNFVDDTGDTAVVQLLVVLLNADGSVATDDAGETIFTQTGADGSYAFADVPAGDYRVGFQVLGGKDYVEQGADLDGDGRSDDPAASDVANQADPLTVPVGVAMIDVLSTDVFSVAGGEDVQDVDAGLFIPNAAPDAIDDAFTTGEDEVLVENILANDSDPDGDTIEILSANGVSAGTAFSVTSTDGREGNVIVAASGDVNFAFDPLNSFVELNDGETDTVTLTYTITDGNGLTDTAEVEVTIEGEGQPTADVSGFIGSTGSGDRHVAVVFDTSQDAVSIANAFPVDDFDNDGNFGTAVDQMLSKTSDLALTLQDTDLITLIPSGFNQLPDSPSFITFQAGVLKTAIATDQANGDIAVQQAIYNSLVSSYDSLDFTIDFEEAFDIANGVFSASTGIEQNKVIAMVASEATVEGQGGTFEFVSADVPGAFSDLTAAPALADVDILVIPDGATVNADNLAGIDSDGAADVDTGGDFALENFIEDTPIVSSAGDLVSFEITVDGTTVPDVDFDSLTPVADGFDFGPTGILEGEIDVIIGLAINNDGNADQFRRLSDDVSAADRTLAQGDVFDFTLDAFLSDQISLGG